MRIAPATLAEITARARATGRSVTQEADRLLQQALIIEQAFGRTGLRSTYAIMADFLNRGAATATERGVEGDWTQDAGCYQAAIYSAVVRMLTLAPEPWDPSLSRTYLMQANATAALRRESQS
jgi:hypothetical protein